jgi:hypothetical protein
MPANLYVAPYGIGFSILQLEESYPGQLFPVLVLYYEKDLLKQITKKVLSFINEDNIFICIAKKPNGSTEVSLFFVVDYPDLVEIDTSSILAEFISEKELTEEGCLEAKQGKKVLVSQIISGIDHVFSKEKTDMLLELGEKEGFFLIMLGTHNGKRLFCPDWCVQKRREKIFHFKEELLWVISEKCGLEVNYWEV